MASVSSGSRDCHQGDASMEVEAREMSRLAANAAGMSRHTTIAAQRLRHTVESARRSFRAIDVTD